MKKEYDFSKGRRNPYAKLLKRVLIGFKSEDDGFDYRLENDPRFLRRVETARESVRAGRGVKLEDVDE